MMAGDKRSVSWTRAALAVAGIVVLLWVLATGRPPRSTMLLHEIYNLGHIPLFGLIALLALSASRALFPGLSSRPFSHYLIAFVSVAWISLVSEVMQVGVAGRQAEVQDAVHNLIGAICFLAIWSAFDTRLWTSDTRAPRGLLVGAALFALFVSFWSLFELAWLYGMRAAAFPVLVDFDGRWQKPFLLSPRAVVSQVPAPAAWQQKAGETVAEIRFPQERWPGVTIREPYPDWTGYSAFRMQVYSERKDPVPLTLRIEDINSTHEYKDGFNRTIAIQHGHNEVSVPLADTLQSSGGRVMDLSQISQLTLFTSRPEDPFRLYMSDVWLE